MQKCFDDIETHNQEVDFKCVLSQLKDDDEVNNFDIQDLFNLDFDKLREIKIKCKKFLESFDNISTDINDNKLFKFFADRYKVKFFLFFFL